MSSEKIEIEKASEMTKEQLRERLKDVYPRLRRKKIKESCSYFMSDLRISENQLKDGEITEEQFYDDLSDLMHNYGIEWGPNEDRKFIRPKKAEK
ncbi:MAG: hypothetical protein A3B31_00635 [Candidatus Komeilibacteria bacterium RIFCSPLOWO2_01_FULL_53_11]|uniref:Uncharacterized protein n=1 Tax=Candidatus Komeilibacteria bacterium RIFCSPLOWO2_01_FULL_53_11 TaxID=1798552 RepID=A0A1G2BRB5_9BACT|nr:MAG: hypothetical protein A3B31_00635 [Candidatus Komeilibacteria bacterium RIFCSPLOWO2_01_FULL_53_11]